jgi:hypothetical protein
MTAVDPAPGARSPGVLVATTTALTLLACAAAARGWPLPVSTPSGWRVSAVPPSLFTLVAGTAVLCLAVATGLVRPAGLGSRAVAGTWCLVAAAAAAALGWRDVLLAAVDATGDSVVPELDGGLVFAAALLAGLLTLRRGRDVQLTAVLGTAVVTLPLVGLGWSLTDGTTGLVTALSGGVYAVGVFGVLPVLLAVALSRVATSRGHRR